MHDGAVIAEPFAIAHESGKKAAHEKKGNVGALELRHLLSAHGKPRHDEARTVLRGTSNELYGV